MKSLCREATYAALAWLIPFATSVCLFPLKRSHPPLFESLMGITLVGTTVLLGCLYLRRRADRCTAGLGFAASARAPFGVKPSSTQFGP